MEVISQFTVTDLVILVTLAGGVLVGFQQGLLRYILNAVVVVASFILAALLKGPIAEAVNPVWDFGTPAQQELWFFVGLLTIGIIGGFFVVRLFYRETRLPIIRQLDEIGGAIVGVVWVALIYTVSYVVLDSFFNLADPTSVAAATILGPLYDALSQSVIMGWFREWLLPVVGFVARPFVPSEMGPFLQP